MHTVFTEEALRQLQNINSKIASSHPKTAEAFIRKIIVLYIDIGRIK